MGKISNTWALMLASWEVLKKDKEILLFPLFSGVSCLAVLASFAIPIFIADAWEPPALSAQPIEQVTYYGTWFGYYLCNYFVIVFFNTAMVGCAGIRLGGGDPTVGDGFKIAMQRLPQVLGWSLLSAIIGLVLRAVEERSETVGKVVVFIIGAAWTLASYLAVPVLVFEGKGPIGALKESSRLFKKTWGEHLVSNAGFGLVFFLLILPGVGLIALGFFLKSQVLLIACVGVAVFYLLILSLVQTALQSIFQTALYLHLQEGKSLTGYPTALLEKSMTRR